MIPHSIQANRPKVQKAAPLLFIGYVLLAVFLAERKPLWLDEIVQQLHTRGVPFQKMVVASRNPGASFLPDLLQWIALKFGTALLLSRLPALVFGAGSVLLFWKLARATGMRHTVAITAVFALLPINLRYMTEGRPYSQGLFFTILSLLLVWKIAERTSWLRSSYLALTAAAALYSQPFAIFPISAAAASFAIRSRGKNGRSLVLPIVAASLLFLPWWLVSAHTWNGAPPADAANAASTVFDWKTPLRVLRESTGAGYLEGVCLLLLLAIACTRKNTGLARWFLAIGLAGFLFTLLSEDRLHYYFAARHLLFSLPALVLAAGFALEARIQPGPSLSQALCVLSMLICGITIATEGSKSRENWQAAAQHLASLEAAGYCLAFADPAHLQLFSFFEPHLSAHTCQLAPRNRMAFVIDPYSSADRARLASEGWSQAGAETVGKVQILRWTK